VVARSRARLPRARAACPRPRKVVSPRAAVPAPHRGGAPEDQQTAEAGRCGGADTAATGLGQLRVRRGERFMLRRRMVRGE
jgi:hypothetical protein